MAQSGTCNHGLRSDLMPEHGARERFLMGTNVNTPKLQVPTPEFGHGLHGTWGFRVSRV